MMWVALEHAGQKWEVASEYLAPVGIGEAARIAQERGAELPTPELVDAIWRAADLKVSPIPMVPNKGDDAEQFRAHADRIAAQLEGKEWRLLAGTHKDVVRVAGKLGLYGWHRLDGRVIQGFFGGHALAWKDYSQGLRLVRRAGGAPVASAVSIVGGAIGGAAGGLAFGWPGAVVGAALGVLGGRVVKVRR